MDIKYNLQKWMVLYEYAKKYFKEKGDLLVPYNYKIEDYNLGQWIVNQRRNYKDGTLKQERIELLNSIEMIWDINEYQWNIGFNYVKQYYEKHGDLAIISYTIDNFNLGQWISHQRKSYKDGTLKQERIELLNSIEMIWDTYEHQWSISFNYAKEYYEKHGNLDVMISYTIDGFTLGQWISHQRKSYKDGTLKQERIELLNSIEMIWDINEYQWDIGFNYAKQYYEKYGSLAVIISYIIDNFNLGRWISSQRDNYKYDKLKQEKIKLLNSIEMIWDIFEYQWNISFNYAKEYYEKHGNLAIITSYTIDNFNLGQWISDQRKGYKKGTLEQERIKALNTIGMVWDKNEYDWGIGFLHAEQYYKEFNNLKVHVKYRTLDDDYALGSWISTQRTSRKGKSRGVITQTQIERLDKIGMIWDADKTNSIPTSFAEQAIFYFIALLFNNAINSYKELGYDIDIYLPNLKLGIEYDGYYFHKDRYEKDYSKNEKCLKDEITLIRIREPKLKGFENCVCYTRENYNNKDLEKTITWLIQYINKSFNKDFNLDIDIKRYKHTIIKKVGMNSSENWQDEFNFAKEYCEGVGDLDVELGYIYKGFNLGKWLFYQRQALKGASGRILPQYKKDLLDSIGMIWDPIEYKWMKSFNYAKRYYQMHGDLIMFCHYTVDGFDLGNWVYRQRRNHKNNTLSKEKIELLNSIGMNWNFSRGSI